MRALSVQIVCVLGKCYPGWAHTDDEARYLASHPHLWLNSTFCLHTAWPDPVEFTTAKTIRISRTIFGEVARTILRASGIELVELERMHKLH